jgi:membrane protease YdiL (CAAX protease family)
MAFPKHLIVFLLVTFAWSWGFWLIPYLHANGVALPDFLLGLAAESGSPAAWGPLVGAIVAALTNGGPKAVLGLLKRCLSFRFGWRWYLAVFSIFPLIIGISVAIELLAGGELPPSDALQNPAIIPIAFIFILLLGGPLQEEFGWRGTLLDPLQDRFGALWASLMVGFVWGIWHIPLFHIPNDTGFYDRPFWGLLVTTMMISVLFTWIYNNTDRSLVAMLIFHTMFNLSHYVFPVIGMDTAALVLFALQLGAAAMVVFIYGAKTLVRDD